MTRFPAIALVLTAPLTGVLSAQTLADTFARMDKTARELKSVSAGINRDVHTTIIDDDEIDVGTIRLKREKSGDTSMLIDFTGKAAKSVSLDGSTVSIYYPKSKTVDIFEVGEKKKAVEQFLLLGFGATSTEMQQSYTVNWAGVETMDGQQTGHLKLTPKAPDVSQQVSSAELWISENNGLPVQQKIIFKSSGDYWIVKYSSLKLNPPLSDDSLKLKVPKEGVQIQHHKL